MVSRHLDSAALSGRVIDGHAHLGVSLKSFAAIEYPYAQSLEDHYYRQLRGGVGASIVFPLAPDLFFDLRALVERGECRPAEAPLSPRPYEVENRMLLREVYEFFPELADRFLPFVSFDPGRMVSEQVETVRALAETFPIYGIKILPVFCQSPVTCLLDVGQPILNFARERDLPLLLHTTADANECYSHAGLAFSVIERHPELRFCLAHCIGFDRVFLERAAALPNVFVDTAALTIQVQLAHEGSTVMAQGDRRFPADYADHTRVMEALARAYPNTLIWGSDAPAYTYIVRRRQSEDRVVDFRLKARYEDEVRALQSLPDDLRRQVSNENPRRLLFGGSAV